MSARLNVGHLDDNQPAVSDSDSLDQLVLSEADAIYVPIATFLVSLLAFAALAETYNGGMSKPWAAADNIVLDASAAGFRLSVLGRPIATAVVHNHWPAKLPLIWSRSPRRRTAEPTNWARSVPTFSSLCKACSPRSTKSILWP
jgi:hypothetical protein